MLRQEELWHTMVISIDFEWKLILLLHSCKASRAELYAWLRLDHQLTTMNAWQGAPRRKASYDLLATSESHPQTLKLR